MKYKWIVKLKKDYEIKNIEEQKKLALEDLDNLEGGYWSSHLWWYMEDPKTNTKIEGYWLDKDSWQHTFILTTDNIERIKKRIENFKFGNFESISILPVEEENKSINV